MVGLGLGAAVGAAALMWGAKAFFGSKGSKPEEEKIDDEKTSVDLKTAIDIKAPASVTKESIKTDSESALKMMQKELKPLSDEFVQFVAEKYKFPESALARLSKVWLVLACV